MAFNRAVAPVYSKGTIDVWCHNPLTGDLDYYSNKVQQNQLQTSINNSPINAGIGNPIVIQIPDSAAINLTLTAADMSLEARALQVGGQISYNGIVPVMESIKANGTVLSVTKAPAVAYGFSAAYAFIDNSGTAYTVDTDTYQIQGFTAESGKSYCVRYFISAASAKQLRISSVFAPSVEVVMIRIPAYSAQGSTANAGSHVGDFFIWIPRMQFSGNAGLDASQTTASTTDVSGTALSYDDAAAQGLCSAEEAYGSLAYYVYMPLAGATSAVEGLAIVGGTISLRVGDTIQLPVKYVIDGQLVQPEFSDLSYESSAVGTATVVANSGAVTGVQAGSCEITATLAEPSYSVVCNCVVTAS